jgi:cbb3-type cytochrome oxidase maturation protein
MEVIYFMVPIALLLSLCGLAAFIWATKNGQYDDVQTPALRMLNDDEMTTERKHT